MSLDVEFEDAWSQYMYLKERHPGLGFDTFCLFLQAYELMQVKELLRGDEE